MSVDCKSLVCPAFRDTHREFLVQSICERELGETMWLSVNTHKNAFGTLFDYISKNSIPMTAPVVSEVKLMDGVFHPVRLSFFIDPNHQPLLPVEEAPDSVPEGVVYVRRVPARTLIVDVFPGWGYSPDSRLHMFRQTVPDVATFEVAHYDSPFWPLVGRRNEIWASRIN